MPRYVSGKIPIAGSKRAARFAAIRARELVGGTVVRRAQAAAPAYVKMQTERYYGGKLHEVRSTPNMTMEVARFPGFGLLPSITAGAQVRLATRFDRFGKKSQLVDIPGFKQVFNRLLAIAGLPHIGARFLMWHVGRWALMNMVYLTPVDTGQAAGGWSISPQLRGKGKGYGRVGFRIQNPVPYILALEYGHSQKAPQGMQRITFQEAHHHLKMLTHELMMWWLEERILLRNMRFDLDMAAGVAYDPEKVERRIPRLTWQRLINMLKGRLPLDKPVAHLNANVFLAMRVDDPKDWHTVHDFQESAHTFDARIRRTKVDVIEHDDVPVGFAETFTMSRKVGTRTQKTVEHVTDQADLPLSKNDLQQQANQLQRQWRGQK